MDQEKRSYQVTDICQHNGIQYGRAIYALDAQTGAALVAMGKAVEIQPEPEPDKGKKKENGKSE